MDFSAILGPLDPSQLGVDTAFGGSIVGLTGWTTDEFKKFGWDGKLKRFYFFLPFLVSALVVACQSGFHGLPGIVSSAIRYGIYATILLHGHKKVVQGK